MKKAIGVVVGVVVVVGAAWTAGAWYTGKRLEDIVRQQVADGNARLQKLFPGGEVTLALDTLERHVFSTDIVTRIRIHGGPGAKPPAGDEDVIDIASHVGHGPFPLQRLRKGQLAPMMAAGTFQLQENDTVRPWFALTQGVPPVSGTAVVSYTQAVAGHLRIEPVKVARDDAALDFSGLSMDYSQDADKHARADGAIDSVVFKTLKGEAPGQVEITGVTLASDMRPGPADLQIGTTALGAKRVALSLAGGAPVTLSDYRQRTEVGEDKGLLGVHAAYDVAMVNIGGRDIGTAQLALGAKNLAPEAIKSLASLYGRLWSRAMDQTQAKDGVPAEPALTPEEQALALSARDALLAANPNLYIDPILLKTAHGEARFTLNLDLAKPEKADLPLDERIAQTLRKLDARASLAQPLLADLLAGNMQRDGMDAAAASAQAQALAAVMGKAAASSGYATVQGTDIVSTLHYADRVVDLNGNKMPLDQFAGMVLQGVMGMMAQPDMDEPDEDEPDEDQPEDADPDSQQQDQAPAAGRR
ncbi:YdgA family protein [Bordetella bronchialis]|uniref:YdgA family protein n=1 Tax=Bordetella bronchialis TaxID=463025 RepID=UPI0009F492E4|nr:YdgA family protein [Bordetella bronchialis]